MYKTYNILIGGNRFTIRVPARKSILCNGEELRDIDVSSCVDIEIEYNGVRKRIDVDLFTLLVLLVSSEEG